MPWGAAELAARHAVTDLVNAHPHLWPLLNRLTLTSPNEHLANSIDWCAVLQIVSDTVNTHTQEKRECRMSKVG